ncbi:di-trans,poly-cis-decaprenylcistransferase [Candidatus Micrarchaeota archaeon CG1_02_55_22]|nr:MAG: di-trans,poly-cis-decaprenylcistransferase [Candidatus Micrarchaeota archaeon CG1_02_55_22]
MAPKNVAIIPDGNRRYSVKAGLQLPQAYSAGFAKVREALDWARDGGVREMSFWALSLENFAHRSLVERNIIFKSMARRIDEALESHEFTNANARVSFFGKKTVLPKSLQTRINALEESTSGNSDFQLNIGLAYSGQDELINASKQIALKLKSGEITEKQLAEMDEKSYSQYLYTTASPDLVIRTGNVQRLSGFLPFQTAYSEYYFSPKLWPEFTQPDFAAALAYYDSTERRFGK